MRHVLIAAAALTVSAFAASTVVKAQTYHPGAPEQVGSMCKVNTDSNDEMENYGYYQACGQQAVAQAPARRKR